MANHPYLISREEAFEPLVNALATALLLKLHAHESVHRAGIGDSLDALSVKDARTVVAELDKELTRIEGYRRALIRLKGEVVRSVR